MPNADDTSRLSLPPMAAVERALGLEAEDREDIRGLYNLNSRRVPTLRVWGFQAILAFALLHNVVRFGTPEWSVLLPVAVIIEAYVICAYVVLRRFFARVRAFHLGTLFVVLDIVAFTLVVYATGAARSWLWPLYLVRVADQMWIGRRRAALMGGLCVAAYAVLLVGTGLAQEAPVPWVADLFRVALLAAFGAYLIAVSGLPWDLQERTHAAKELIARLEAQSLELERERRRAEHASRAKSDFVARMSHELRTPLNSVVGFANVLLRRSGEIGPREKDYFGRIRDNGMHLLALVNDVLDIARIEEGKMAVHPTDVDLAELVRSTTRQLEGRLIASDVRLTVALPPSLDPLRADEIRLRQVLINLLGNAIKFTREGWIRVEVTADADGGRPMALSVADSGIGIDSAHLSGVFEAFEQAEGGATRKFGGTGLGLAISRSLCDLMGFTLTAESTPGAGSRFTVTFAPVPPQASEELSPPEPRPA